MFSEPYVCTIMPTLSIWMPAIRHPPATIDVASRPRSGKMHHVVPLIPFGTEQPERAATPSTDGHGLPLATRRTLRPCLRGRHLGAMASGPPGPPQHVGQALAPGGGPGHVAQHVRVLVGHDPPGIECVDVLGQSVFDRLVLGFE